MTKRNAKNADPAEKLESSETQRVNDEPAAPAGIAPQDASPGGDAEQGAVSPSVELDALRDRLLRLQADFDNFRKRTSRERDEVVRRANENIMAELIAVLDNLDFGLQHASEQEGGEAFSEGLKIIAAQLHEVLKRFGLQPVDAEGQPFDPQVHEAISHIPSDEHEEGRVIVQTRKGYKLGDKLLRPALVVVSSGSPGTGENEADGEAAGAPDGSAPAED